MRIKWEKDELDRFVSRLETVSEFNKAMKEACRDIARALHKALEQKTPVISGKLKSGWGGNNLLFTAKRVSNGYRVELINQVEYAPYVNDGHYSYNQFNKGGQPYVVHDRTVKYYQGNRDKTFVFGVFFVEKSVVEVGNSRIEQYVFPHIEKWFRWCLGD